MRARGVARKRPLVISEYRAGSSDKPRSCQASGRLRNVHRSPLRARHADAFLLRWLALDVVDHQQGGTSASLPASTLGSNLIHRDAPALDRSDPVKSRLATNPQSSLSEFEAEIA